MKGEAEAAFRWPPGPAIEGASPPEITPAQPAWGAERPGGLGRVLRAIEDGWLGVASAPIARLRAAGWRPDGPLAYCPRCGQDVGAFEADGDGCPRCRGARPPWDRLVRLGLYEGELREAVLAAKFQAWRRVGAELGRLVGASIAERLGALGIPPQAVQLVPLPMTAGRRMARGIDHTLTLARGASAVSGAPVVRLLRRAGRPAQVSLTATERGRAQTGAFWARAGAQAGPLVVVVDDVSTTGATLRAACRAVAHMQRDAGLRPRVWGAVVAVTPAPGRRRRGGRGARFGGEMGGQRGDLGEGGNLPEQLD